MSDRLLAEGTIRRFMKLANVEGLTDNFIQETAKDKREEKMEAQQEEDVVEEQEEDILDEQDEDEDLEIDMGEDPEAMDAAAEPDADMPGGEEMGPADMSLTEEEAQLLISLGERLKEAMAGADEEEPEPEVADADMGDMEEMGDEEEPAPAVRYESQDELVQEILKRVTKRIVSARTK